MPELPEVETIVRDLRPALVGRTFTDVEVLWPGSIHAFPPEQFRTLLKGRRIEAITRRAKFLVMQLDAGWHLLIHLRMTGQLLLRLPTEAERKHTRLIFYFDQGAPLTFRDTRKFGRVYLTQELESVVGDLGPEPLDDTFDGEALAALLQRRSGMLKPLLLNQRFLAGLGNIYADEALFLAGLHPCRRVDTLTGDEIARLCEAIRRVLAQGIRNRGTTLDDFRDSLGCPGRNQESLLVHNRAEEPCPRCGAPIQRSVVGGRGTYHCPCCQKP